MPLLYARLRLSLSHWGVLQGLISKQYKSRYANTALGVLWAVITPLLISLTVAFVFTQIAKVSEKNFVAYVISGMLPWLFFAASVQESALALNENAPLWKQFKVPLEFMPAACVAVNFLNLALGLAVASFFLLRLSPKDIFLFLLLPVPLALHFLFTLGLAFIVSSLSVRRKDTVYFLNVFMLFWLWATPVFYLRESFSPHIQRVFDANIMVPFLNLYRSVYYQSAFFRPQDLLSAAALALVSFLGGYYFFLKREDEVKKAL
jgi:ABC-type polysaccharide/polyol phosphate export permease